MVTSSGRPTSTSPRRLGVRPRALTGAVVAAVLAGGAVAASSPADAADAAPRLQVVASVIGGAFTAGQERRWTVTLVNTGTATASGPARLVGSTGDWIGDVRGTGTGWTCPDLGSCAWTGALAPGAVSPPLTLVAPALPVSAVGARGVGNVTTTLEVDDSAAGGSGQGGAWSLTTPVSDARSPRVVPVVERATGAPLVSGRAEPFRLELRNVGGSPASRDRLAPQHHGYFTDDEDGTRSLLDADGTTPWSCVYVGPCQWEGGDLLPATATPPITVNGTFTVPFAPLDARTAAVEASVESSPGRSTSAVLATPVTSATLPRLFPVVRPVAGPLSAGQTPALEVALSNPGGTASAADAAVVTLATSGTWSGWSPAGSGWTCTGLVCRWPRSIGAGRGTTWLRLTPTTGSGAATVTATLAQKDPSGADAPTSDTSTVVVPRSPAAADDLGVQVASNVRWVPFGVAAKSTVQVRNVGTAARTGAVLRLTWNAPRNDSASRANGEGWTCTGVAAPAGTQARLCRSTATVAAGASFPTLFTQATGTGDMVVTATLVGPTGAAGTAADTAPANDSAQLRFASLGPLPVTASVTTDPYLQRGQTFHRTLRATNVAGYEVPGPFEVYILPILRRPTFEWNGGWGGMPGDEYLPVTSWSGTGWTCDVRDLFGQRCRWEGRLAPGQSTAALQVDTAASAFPTRLDGRTVLDNRLNLTFPTRLNGFPQLLRSQVGLEGPTVDLTGVLDGPASPPRQGAAFTATLRLGNLGRSPATGATTVTLTGDGAGALTASGSGWACGAAAVTLTCSTTAGVGAGAALPALTVTGRAQQPAAEDGLPERTSSVTAAWSNPSDQVTDDTAAVGLVPAS
ncbi:MAG: hypothetical protein U0Q15_02855 [Kineosporiaceae bacterium]